MLDRAGQNKHRQPTKPATRQKPKQTVADGPGQVLCWDITYLPAEVRGKFYYLYVFLDIWSCKIVSWGVHEEQCGQFAADLLRAACESLGTCAIGARLHSDNGSPMKGSTMLSTMQWHGIVPSFSRPNVSDDNPFVESVFRTLKYRPGTPARFASLADAVSWVGKLVRWYNLEHLHSGIGLVTPEDRHTGATSTSSSHVEPSIDARTSAALSAGPETSARGRGLRQPATLTVPQSRCNRVEVALPHNVHETSSLTLTGSETLLDGRFDEAYFVTLT